SSRRRHTISKRDWSSDVCSSDLTSVPESLWLIGTRVALGIWRAGATLVPINHKLSGTEVAYLAEHSGISLGIVSEELAATASEAAPKIDWLTTNDDLTGSFDAAVGQAPAWEGVAVSEDDVAQILYTSGTVSRP